MSFRLTTQADGLEARSAVLATFDDLLLVASMWLLMAWTYVPDRALRITAAPTPSKLPPQALAATHKHEPKSGA